MKSLTNDEIILKFAERKRRDLILSILIDSVGSASYVFPGIGEGTDLAFAPVISAAIYYVHKTKIGATIGFIEEALPFSDIIPTATGIWYRRYKMNVDRTFQEFVGESKEYDKFKQILEGGSIMVENSLNRQGKSTTKIISISLILIIVVAVALYFIFK